MKHPNAAIEKILTHLASPHLSIIDLSLDRIFTLLEALGNPHDHLPPVIHIAGTNGKGSLAAYLTAIFQAANYRVHRFTSPYLVRLNEEIVLANQEITDARLWEVLQRVQEKASDHPVTYFEAITAAAFLAFRETPADVLILETGLGGRLDATNVIRQPAATAITPISLDHTEFLGTTIAAIAGEKAGIIKPGVPCVVGPQADEAMAVIEGIGKKLLLYRHDHEWTVHLTENGFHYHSETRDGFFPKPNLVGQHQINNAATAIAMVDCLKNFNISDKAIARGITHAIWPARLQKLSSGKLAALLPASSELWLDGGHNPSAGAVIADWAKTQTKPIHLICGMLKTKDSKEFLRPLAPLVKSLQAVAIPDEPQSQTPEALYEIADELNIPSGAAESITQAIKNILNFPPEEEGPKSGGVDSQKNSIILICGSLYLAGHVLLENGIGSHPTPSPALGIGIG
jgi:dihydrofolate synthase/folylpolyglutamate synthase